MKKAAQQLQRHFFQRKPLAESVFQLFHQLPGACLYVKDLQSRFVHVSQGVLALYDLEDETAMLGRTDRDFQPPILAEAYIAEDRRVIQRRKPILAQLWLVPHLRGTPQWYVSSKVPLFDARQEVIGLAGVMFKVERPLEKDRYLGRLKSALDYLEANYARAISISEAAARCGMPSTTFNRRFRELLRMTPTEYLLSWRIEAARKQLIETQHSLARIAAECGFADQSHFTKRFRRNTGLTPLAYRKRFKH
jgi:AraC-like DNA-binding protein